MYLSVRAYIVFACVCTIYYTYFDISIYSAAAGLSVDRSTLMKSDHESCRQGSKRGLFRIDVSSAGIMVGGAEGEALTTESGLPGIPKSISV